MIEKIYKVDENGNPVMTKTGFQARDYEAEIKGLFKTKILAEETIDWIAPYLSKHYGSYRSFSTKKSYDIGVTLQLAMQGAPMGQLYITKQHATKLGWRANKGSHWFAMYTYGVPRKKVKVIDDDGNEREEWQVVGRAGWKCDLIMPLCDLNGKGIEKYQQAEAPKVEPIPNIEKVLLSFCEAQGITVQHSDLSCGWYRPSTDTVNVPLEMKSVEEYFSCFIHEVGHATGHEKRLNRKGKEYVVLDPNGRHNHAEEKTILYAQEELVAELTSVLGMSHTSLATEATENNSVAYLQHFCNRTIPSDLKKLGVEKIDWKQILASRPEIITYACTQATKAFKMIFNVD